MHQYRGMPRLSNDQTAVGTIVLTLSHSAKVPAAVLCCICLQLGSDTEVAFAGVTGPPPIPQLRSCCCGMKWACSSTNYELRTVRFARDVLQADACTSCQAFTGVGPHGTACHLCLPPPASTASGSKPRSQCYAACVLLLSWTGLSLSVCFLGSDFYLVSFPFVGSRALPGVNK